MRSGSKRVSASGDAGGGARMAIGVPAGSKNPPKSVAKGGGSGRAKVKTRAAQSEIGPVEPYRPTIDEEFMNPRQLDYFRRKLLAWKDEILRESRETLDTLQAESLREPDVTDRASSETDWSIELRTRDRQRKLISKIDAALQRIEDGEYGFCEVTGEPISLQRLDARPIATMTLEAQEQHERRERVTRED